MRAITTKYHGPTNYMGARISATATDSKRVYVPYDYSLTTEGAHAKAASKLMARLGWTGKLIGGHTNNGMVWVSTEGYELEVK
jgi:hypothetical protein